MIDSMKVRMTHPDLPDQPIEVFDFQVATHETNGWIVEADPAIGGEVIDESTEGPTDGEVLPTRDD